MKLCREAVQDAARSGGIVAGGVWSFWVRSADGALILALCSASDCFGDFFLDGALMAFFLSY